MAERPSHSVRDLASMVADPETFAGGGAIAAASLAGAAATAELVAILTHRRPKLSNEERELVGSAVQTLQGLRDRFLSAIDEDIDALQELMDAMRSERLARDSDVDHPPARERLERAVERAISVPVSIAEDGVRIARLVEQVMPHARPFTRSDLGAAATLANGAVEATLLMARANLPMMSDQQAASRWLDRITAMESDSTFRSARIVSQARGATDTQEGAQS